MGNLTFTDGNVNRTRDGLILNFPAYKAKIYLTYKDINNDFEGLMEQTYKMNVKNHIIKGRCINEQVFNNHGRTKYMEFFMILKEIQPLLSSFM